MEVTQAYHPLLHTLMFISKFPRPLKEMHSPDWLKHLLTLQGEAERPKGHLPPKDEIFKMYRALLRWGGFKPSGRSKPAAEYLVKAAAAGELNSINAAVDVLNGVSLHLGLPIGVIDLDLCQAPLHIDLGREGESYIFNKSGQEMNLKGLIVMRDQKGPCANPVKDSQRTKTNDETKRTLTIVWGNQECMEPALMAVQWQKELLLRLGAEIEEVTTVFEPSPTSLA
ncbi:MAG: phenylalanine--tRNA ligase beta subunit-related protein [Candidatus Bruticola sp.]